MLGLSGQHKHLWLHLVGWDTLFGCAHDPNMSLAGQHAKVKRLRWFYDPIPKDHDAVPYEKVLEAFSEGPNLIEGEIE